MLFTWFSAVRECRQNFKLPQRNWVLAANSDFLYRRPEIFQIGFPANETFRKKMQKFSFVFRKLFRVISHVFAKMNEAKNAKKANFANIFVEYATCFLKKKNLIPYFLRNFCIFLEIFDGSISWNGLKRNFAKKSEIFSSQANKCEKCEKMRNFRETIFPFCWKP